MLRIITLFITICLITLSSQNALGRTYSQRVCHDDPGVACMVVKKGNTWDSLWPDPAQREIAMRINRMNTELYPGMRLIIPDEENQSEIISLLPFPRNIGNQSERTILVSKKGLAWAAYDTDGSFVRWGPASTALGFCPDIGKKCVTPSGAFTIYRKEGDDCISTKFPVPYGGAPMPYCMYFRGGFAVHGSGELPGYNASHGCVRILPTDAQWLNQNFITVGETQVIVRE